MAEKLRAVGGQRRFAVSRDVYDIGNLQKAGVDLSKIKAILPQKFQARGLSLSQVSIDALENRKSEFQQDWNRRLSYLVQEEQGNFESDWASVTEILHQVLSE